MKIRECMTHEVRLIQPDQSLAEAARMMAEVDAGILPVSDGDRLVGMITDRDMAIRGLGCDKGPGAKVGEVMNPEVRYCYDDDDIDDVLHNMADLQVRRLPVLDRGKRLVGIISLGDLAGASQSLRAGAALSGISRPGGRHTQTLH